MILRGPIRRCNLLCQEFEKAIQEFVMKPMTGLRDWSDMEFTTGDINEFIDILIGYQATISVGLDTVNKQLAKLSHKALEEFKEKLREAVYTLDMNLERVDEQMNLNGRENQNAIALARNIELKEEREMINQCLRICQAVSSHIRSLADQEGPLEDRHPSESFPGSQSLLKAQILIDRTSSERQWLQQRAAHQPSRGTFTYTKSPSSRTRCADDALDHDVEITANSKSSAVLSYTSPTSSGSANSARPATSLSLKASADGTDEVVGALASRRVTPEDFEDACKCCIFWLFSPENFDRQACSSLKEEISHIITHMTDHHGLIRGNDPQNAFRKYLASCQTNNPLIKAKGVCEKCSSIYKWNDEDFMDSAHYGIVLCLRCWHIFNKKEMQHHMSGPLCPWNAEKSKHKKVCDLYTAFCSESYPPSTPPQHEREPRTVRWRRDVDQRMGLLVRPGQSSPVPQPTFSEAISLSDQESLPSPLEPSPSLGLSTAGESLEPLLSPNLDKPAYPDLPFPCGGDSATASLTTDGIFTSGENQKSNGHQVATPDTSIRHAEEAVEFEADKGNEADHSEKEEDNFAGNTNDVASIQSFDDDIQSSSSSYKRTPHTIAAERHIGALLAGHPGVNFVLEESIGIMPKDRLKRNIRRSLKLLYLRLREETQSNVHVLATQMFKGRNSRTRISQRTVEEGRATNPGSEEDAERPRYHKDRAFLDSWLSSLQCTEQIDEKPQDLHSLKETHDESDSSTGSGSNVSEQYQAVQVAEDFLISGTAFRAFLTHLTLSLLPVYLRQIMQLAAWGDIELIDTAFKISTSDRIKSSIESLTGSPWNWWPMAPPNIPLIRGHVRMNWKCVSHQ
ncbi:hypothetical protein NW768_000007 [Fusarium equiseti]|uniref:Azaphilone pigments biosynthesis cluster protein L N-terminal domain-containing protein n=1 Tax=Fusarium equiseti TaxID=61235 RepID=A0ABQ8RRD2_FUSEQ|nr:hypothetical protein NW768_000007 [Fusarium equiseti]